MDRSRAKKSTLRFGGKTRIAELLSELDLDAKARDKAQGRWSATLAGARRDVIKRNIDACFESKYHCFGDGVRLRDKARAA
jgi:hypothetical protein